MDYTVRYGLEFNPFLKNSKEILIHTNEYRETRFRLDYPAKTKGFGLLTGSPGNFRMIQDEITRLTVEKRKTPIIIIDEANYISNSILNDLKILFNFEMDSGDRAVVLLTGLPTLNSTLKLSIHEPLRQRIVMNYEIGGLTKEEGREYIPEKLKSAGCSQTQ